MAGASEEGRPIRLAGDDERSRQVRQVLDRLGPAVVRQRSLLDLLDASADDPAPVTAAIGRCPILSARVLSVLNSAAFGLARQVSSVDRAVTLLGASRARLIALAYGMRIVTERTGLSRATVDMLWAGSLAKAEAARRFCELISPADADTAFALGLIQDIGLPMLMAVDPERYDEQVRSAAARSSWTACERATFGFDHAAVGQGLLLEWRASPFLQQAVLGHHRPPPKDLNAPDAGLQLGLFLASLLPHMDEEPAARQVEWVQAIHAKFLYPHYASPEDFIRSLTERTQEMRLSQGDGQVSQDVLVKRLMHEVGASAVKITGKLCRLEHRIRQERQEVGELKFQAFTDPLTKALNRRGFIQLAERRLRLAQEAGQGVCCILGDMDHFKSVNDRFGHETGDQVLRGLAKVMRRSLKASDLIGRLGGDEFAVLVTGVDEAQARELAQRLAGSVEGARLRVRPDLEIPVMLSLGAVYCPPQEQGPSIDQLMTAADRAMYERKRSGKHDLVFGVFDPGQLGQTPAHPGDGAGDPSAE